MVGCRLPRGQRCPLDGLLHAVQAGRRFNANSSTCQGTLYSSSTPPRRLVSGTSCWCHFPHADRRLSVAACKEGGRRPAENSGMTHTILQPTFFTEVWLSPGLGFDTGNGKAQIYGGGVNRISWISFQDVARFSVAALTPGGAANATIKLGGPDALSPLEVVALAEQAVGNQSPSSTSPRTLACTACRCNRFAAAVVRRVDAVLQRARGSHPHGGSVGNAADRTAQIGSRLLPWHHCECALSLGAASVRGGPGVGCTDALIQQPSCRAEHERQEETRHHEEMR